MRPSHLEINCKIYELLHKIIISFEFDEKLLNLRETVAPRNIYQSSNTRNSVTDNDVSSIYLNSYSFFENGTEHLSKIK